MLASTTLSEVLLVLKIAFLVLLYLLIWRILRTAARELRGTAPHQDSMILTPAAAAALGLGGGGAPRPAQLVVQRSPSLETGEAYPVDSAPLTIGRGGQNDLALDGDEFASARHARLERRRDGVWVQDLGSTNGTYVNGSRLEGAQKLAPGDVLRVGETDFRLEEL
ncbi:MAG TPA: FHA domain-containing protein [Gaiellaceae bacterium]|nr:FHA domain-containing protein [Gaiellaceae bacterium]